MKFDAQATFDIFSLHFEALPQKDLTFNMIEKLTSTNNDFHYLDIEIVLNDGVEVLG